MIEPASDNQGLPADLELAELHAHVGASVAPAIMWGIAHDQGIRLPTKDYWDFLELITVKPSKVESLSEYLDIFHWTELIQSSPVAIERAVYETVGGAYRKNNITTLELRYNPMKRNRGGERDLDHIIMASTRGLDRAALEFPVDAGLILCLDRSFPLELNRIIVNKAIQWKSHGIIGIDVAGPHTADFAFKELGPLVDRAKHHDLGVTIHTGEETDATEMWEVVRYLRPHRIGHGIKAAWDPELMAYLQQEGTVLEVCPTSNLSTGVVKDLDELRFILTTFNERGVPFCVNTDGPTMLGTNLRKEMKLLLENHILTREDLLKANGIACKSSFLRGIPEG